MLCSQLFELFNRIEVTGRTFVWAVDSFTLLLRLFSDNINRFVVEARAVSQQKPIAQSLKEDYNTSRQTYNRYLDDYASFVAGLNKRIRTYVHTYLGAGKYIKTTFQAEYV